MNTAAKQPTNLNDDLSDLIGSDPIIPAARVDRAPSTYVPATERVYTEKCPKCSGSGQTRWGVCFRCKGKGGKTFKTSPETRAANRASALSKRAEQETRRRAEITEKAAAWSADHLDVAQWLATASARGFNFAVSLLDNVNKYGSLTDNQLAAAKRCMDQDAQRAAERAASIENAPVADSAGVDRLKAAFDKAIAFTAAKRTDTGMPLQLRSPKITIGSLTISPAKANSTNAGALYVKDAGEYMGKIIGGKFLAVRGCTEEQRNRILAFIADPKAAAEAYGKETGVCCVCNATLTSKWRLAGIGPICATKMGW